jgi:hypothetical protein
MCFQEPFFGEHLRTSGTATRLFLSRVNSPANAKQLNLYTKRATVGFLTGDESDRIMKPGLF